VVLIKIFRSFDSILELKDKRVYAAMGTFDGYHIGHKKLVEKCISEAMNNDGFRVVITFDNHPRLIFEPERRIDYLSTPSEKLALLRRSGVDGCFVMPFDKNVALMEPENFVKTMLVDKINIKKIHVGFNFTYGKRGKGDVDSLKFEGERYGFKLYILDVVRRDNYLVSSTNIRLLLSSGAVEKSERFLGRSYSIAGCVVKGMGLGHRLGFPTANLDISNVGKMLPLNGVYACQVRIMDRCLSGVVNIGSKPTINMGDCKSVEVHILDFSENIYGKRLKIYFKKRLRDEIRFENLAELSETIKRDILRTRIFFERYGS